MRYLKSKKYTKISIVFSLQSLEKSLNFTFLIKIVFDLVVENVI